MAFSKNKNDIFHERVKNYAMAMQGLREEGDRLKDWYFQEISGHADFADTTQSTAAEVTAMINYITDFEKLNIAQAITPDARRISLIPFLANRQ